jgi:hypothetical protein
LGFPDSDAVKRLNEQAAFVGGLFAADHLGQLPAGPLDEALQSSSFCARLNGAFQAVVKEVGDDEALKKALKAARTEADVRAGMAELPAHEVTQGAEQSVRVMILNAMQAACS